VDNEFQIRRLLVPVEMRVDHLVVGAHDLPDLVGNVADFLRVRTDHAELDRKTDWRPEIEPVNTHARFRQRAAGNYFLDPFLDPLTGLDILRDNNDLGEGFVWQLRIESEPEPRRPLADVGGISRDILVAFEQPFGPLHRVERRADRRSGGQPQLEEQLRPLRQWKELLLDMAEAHDRQHKDTDRCEHHGHASLDAPFDDPAQRSIKAGFVNRMRIMPVAELLESWQQLDAEIRGEYDRDQPRGHEGDRDHPKDAAGIFADG